jgi:hypothetical protein
MLVASLWELEQSSDILTVLPGRVSAAANLIQPFWHAYSTHQKEKKQNPDTKESAKTLYVGILHDI